MSLVFPPLYAIIDAALLKTSELSFVEMMAESGVELLQYRNKRATSRQLFEASRSISARLSRVARIGEYEPRFIVNDRADIALLVKAQGVHVGQEDLTVEDARAVVSHDVWVGLSTHSLAQLDAAIPLGRMANPEEIASVVTFLAGEGAGYLTATTIFADGGIMHGSVGL